MGLQPTDLQAEETQRRHDLEQFLADFEVEIGRRLASIQEVCNAQEASAISDLLKGIQEVRDSLRSKEWSLGRITFRIRQLWSDFGWVASIGKALGQ